MIFFTREQKELSRRSSETSLRRGYEHTEQRLNAAAKAGNRRAMNAAMKDHRRYEYALLHKSFEQSKRKKR